MGEFPENNGDSQFSFTTFHKRVSNNGNLYVAFSVDEDYMFNIIVIAAKTSVVFIDM